MTDLELLAKLNEMWKLNKSIAARLPERYDHLLREHNNVVNDIYAELWRTRRELAELKQHSPAAPTTEVMR